MCLDVFESFFEGWNVDGLEAVPVLKTCALVYGYLLVRQIEVVFVNNEDILPCLKENLMQQTCQ